MKLSIFLLLTLWTHLLVAADRVALLIANGQYREPATKIEDTLYLPRLDSPAADLVLMEKTLAAAGFVVTTRADRTTAEMRADVRQFAALNKGVPVVLFYYSGHGLAQDGVNYLAGVDAQVDVSEKLGDLERARASGALSQEMLANALADIKRRKAQEQLMPLEEVLTALSGISGARSDRKIVLLDACRDPFASSRREQTLLATKGAAIIGKGGGGLAKPAERPGMFIGFSAAAGQTAIAFPSKSGKAEPSLFTRIFCEEAAKPGNQLRDVFEAAGVTVYDESQKLIENLRREQRLGGSPTNVNLEPQTPAAYSVVFPPGFVFIPDVAMTSHGVPKIPPLPKPEIPPSESPSPESPPAEATATEGDARSFTRMSSRNLLTRSVAELEVRDNGKLVPLAGKLITASLQYKEGPLRVVAKVKTDANGMAEIPKPVDKGTPFYTNLVFQFLGDEKNRPCQSRFRIK